ncbi:hypothetical protein ACFL3Q_15460 [Planctomycetota bacterium]
MQTELNKLLSSISPEKVIVAIFNRANEAINTFHPKSALIENWDEFRCCMEEFMRYIERHSLRLRGPIDISSDYYWPQCARVLLKVYGPSGEKAAFEIVRTGNKGGLNAVLRSVAMHVAEGYAKTEIQARVDAYLKDLTIDQQLAASIEYLAKHGHLLPSEMTEASAARIHANFGKVLAKHPWLLLKLNEVGR